MRACSIPVLLALLGIAVPSSGTDYYELPNIKRIDQDLYRSEKVVIKTRLCLHRTTGEEALLKYDGPGDYAIVWEDTSTCDVQKIVALD